MQAIALQYQIAERTGADVTIEELLGDRTVAELAAALPDEPTPDHPTPDHATPDHPTPDHPTPVRPEPASRAPAPAEVVGA
jgi:hypothetical protein